ncbi:hypothetical protein [Treponema sp.]|uniref:hypothetical protein n=1 Tax=Treponema sp. TaxID=166 RepID=UPI00298E92B7|nr:hypothetical protein [Treponema sp.]MCR5613049.1 hypothetical protein [Treponema sp.]
MNKKFLSVLIALTAAVQVFALKLPTGDSVRAADAKQDGDDIVEVVIGGENPAEITSPLGKLKVRVGSTVYFYKSGALKQVELIGDRYGEENSGVVETEIGKFIPCSTCSFYESGSLKSMFIDEPTTFTVGGIVYGVMGVGYNEDYRIEFYDSGTKDKFLVKRIFTYCYETDDKKIYSVSFKNKSGTYELSLDKEEIQFFKDGTIKSGYLAKSPDEPAIVKGEEVFISSNTEIYFYENGNICAFTSDELCMTNQGGTKLNIPAKTYIVLYQNGTILLCSCSNEVTVKTKSYKSEDNTNTMVIFNADGTLRAVRLDDGYYIDTFYSDGSIKRKVSFNGEKPDIIFYNFNGVRVERSWTGSSIFLNDGKYKYLYVQDGDKTADIGMIYFDDAGNPSSYSLTKRNNDGKVVFDETDFPEFETARKRFIVK